MSSALVCYICLQVLLTQGPKQQQSTAQNAQL